MRITQFEIQLQNPQPVYYAGQTIAGQVHLVLSDELDFRAITLALHGDANVSSLYDLTTYKVIYDMYTMCIVLCHCLDNGGLYIYPILALIVQVKTCMLCPLILPCYLL